QIMARANEKAEALDAQIRKLPSRTSNPMYRRWVVARDGAIYHYDQFEPLSKSLVNLTIYRPRADAWALQSQTFATRIHYDQGQWTAAKGWEQNFVARKGGY